jgi:hypothetical protein
MGETPALLQDDIEFPLFQQVELRAQVFEQREEGRPLPDIYDAEPVG